MGYTKREHILEGYDKAGLKAYLFDLTPEDLQSALRLLDQMIAYWGTYYGIHLRYPLPEDPKDSKLDQDSNIPNGANAAVQYNLAIWIANGHGKEVSQNALSIADQTFRALKAQATPTLVMQLPGDMPAGAGNRRGCGGAYRNYITPPEQWITAGPNNYLPFY